MSARNRRRRGKSGDEQQNEQQNEQQSEYQNEQQAGNRFEDPYAGADADVLFGRREAPRRSAEHKDRQLCEQVFQILSYVMSSLEDEVLSSLAVSSVEPGLDSSRLLVTMIAMEPRHSVDEIVEKLAKSRGLLRTEIASGIHRKRTPDLMFRVMTREEVAGGEVAP